MHTLLDRQHILKKLFYFNCNCSACQHGYPIFFKCPPGTEPHLRNFLGSARITNQWTEKEAIDVYNKTCQYLLVYGKLPASLKVMGAQEVLVFYFYLLMNNIPLKWTFGDLHRVIFCIQMVVYSMP